jgi:hypothetical protein
MSRVWSEFPGRNGIVDQCSECGYLMALAHAGVIFSLGTYTVAERDALTALELGRAEARRLGRPMFPLIDAASRVRYGVALRTVTGSNRRATYTELRSAILAHGNATVIPGSYLNVAWDNPLRARARAANGRDYTAGHMVTIVNDAGRLSWLDPLRPMGEPGYPCTIDDAFAFAWTGSDAHVARLGEFAQLPDPAEDAMTIVTIEKYPVPIKVVFRKGTTVAGYSVDERMAVAVYMAPADRSSNAPADARVVIMQDPKRIPNGTFHRITAGVLGGLLVKVDEVDELAPADPPNAGELALATARKQGANAAAQDVKAAAIAAAAKYGA